MDHVPSIETNGLVNSYGELEEEGDECSVMDDACTNSIG